MRLLGMRGGNRETLRQATVTTNATNFDSLKFFSFKDAMVGTSDD